jgi:hypothetical protein
MIDRPIRPLFPKAYFDEVQVMAIVLSADQQNDPDILAVNASSAALSVSPIPFIGPIGAVRVGRLEGQYVLNPTDSQLEFSDMDLVLAGNKQHVNMIELGCQSCSEDVVAGAIEFGHKAIITICEMIEELQAKANPTKQPIPELPTEYTQILDGLNREFRSALRDTKQTVMKQERGDNVRAVKDGAICYMDEVVEARHDSLAILHSLTDHRRALYLDRAGTVVKAPDSFMLVCSYNPAYRSSLKELKPSFRQRLVTVAMNYLPPEREAAVLVAEAGIDPSVARRLVDCAGGIRNADHAFHFEPPSTRALVTAAKLIAAGTTELEAAETCILAPLSNDGAITDGLRELAVGSLLGTGTLDITTRTNAEGAKP